MPNINEVVTNFAVYENGTEYLGMAEITLPDISFITNEIKGAGLNGTFESVALGHLESMTLTLNFRTLEKSAYSLLQLRNHQIDLRVAQQYTDTVDGKTKVSRVKHIFVVRPKKLAPGKAAPASPADASGEYAVTYWATWLNGEKIQEIDILNFICIIDGVDWLEDVRKALGK